VEKSSQATSAYVNLFSTLGVEKLNFRELEMKNNQNYSNISVVIQKNILVLHDKPEKAPLSSSLHLSIKIIKPLYPKHLQHPFHNQQWCYSSPPLPPIALLSSPS